MQKYKNRIVYIDVIKAFAIFIVVWGHICGKYDSNINSFIGDYCISPIAMPLFVILSGFFFNGKLEIKEFLIKKIKSLAVPYIAWCFIVYVLVRGISDFYNYFFYHQDIHILPWIYCFKEAVLNWGWWFIRALLLCYLYAFVWYRLYNKKANLLLLFSVLFLWICSFGGVIPNKNENLIGFIFIYPFFATSIILKQYWKWVEKYEKKFLLLSIVAFALLIVRWNGYPDTFYSMNTSVFEKQGHFNIIGFDVVIKTLYRYITGLTGSLSVILLFKQIKYIGNLKLVPFIGTNTLGVYMIHFFLIDLLPESIVYGEMMVFAMSIFISIVILFVCNVIIHISSKNVFLRQVLWGKK